MAHGQDDTLPLEGESVTDWFQSIPLSRQGGRCKDFQDYKTRIKWVYSFLRPNEAKNEIIMAWFDIDDFNDVIRDADGKGIRVVSQTLQECL